MGGELTGPFVVNDDYGDDQIGGLGSGPRYPLAPGTRVEVHELDGGYLVMPIGENEPCDCCKREASPDRIDSGICDDCYPYCSANYCAVTRESRGGW